MELAVYKLYVMNTVNLYSVYNCHRHKWFACLVLITSHKLYNWKKLYWVDWTVETLLITDPQPNSFTTLYIFFTHDMGHVTHEDLKEKADSVN